MRARIRRVNEPFISQRHHGCSICIIKRGLQKKIVIFIVVPEKNEVRIRSFMGRRTTNSVLT